MKRSTVTALTEVYTLVRVAIDRRTPRRVTALIVLTAAYVLLPVDLISDVIPVVGWSDDLLFGLLGRHAVYRLVPEPVIEEHRSAARSQLLIAVAATLAVGAIIVFIVLRSIGVL